MMYTASVATTLMEMDEGLDRKVGCPDWNLSVL